MPKVQQSGSSGRRSRGIRVSTSLSEINVVPLIDVMLVLLIIFMVTAPMMQQGLEVNLPQARRANPVNSEPVYVTVPRDFATTHQVQLGEDVVSIDVLPERVRQALLTREDKSVYVRPDAAANMQDFFDVTDRLKEGGVDKIALMSKPRETR